MKSLSKERLQEVVREAANQLAQYEAMFEWIELILDGGEPSDFGMSFTMIRRMWEREQLINAKSYYEGYNQGLRDFAWWKDGEQFVGTCGTKLKDALKQ